MKEAVGSYWLTGIVITFIVLFTGYMCLSINTNKAYKVKNEIINIIQKNNGFDENALAQIQDYMIKVGYRTTGDCNRNEADLDRDYAGYSISGSNQDDEHAVFCIRATTTEYETSGDYKDYIKSQFPKSTYYQIKVFFAIDLPVVRHFFTFGLKGSTKKIFYPCERTECLIS